MSFLFTHGLEILGGIVAILTGAYTIALLVPGDQPDKTIRAILDLTEKLSKK